MARTRLSTLRRCAHDDVSQRRPASPPRSQCRLQRHFYVPRARELQSRTSRARLQYGDLGHILEVGVHEYLTDFLRRINELADTIHGEYLEVV